MVTDAHCWVFSVLQIPVAGMDLTQNVLDPAVPAVHLLLQLLCAFSTFPGSIPIPSSSLHRVGGSALLTSCP